MSFISGAAGLFPCLGQGFLESLTVQSELGVLCQRYANNGIETITPDYFVINVISAYPHKSSLFCSYPFYRMIFSMEEDSSSNGCVCGSGLNFIENWSPEDWRPLDSLLSCKLRHPSHEIFYWFVCFILFFYFWFYVISDVVISSSILNNWILHVLTVKQ